MTKLFGLHASGYYGCFPSSAKTVASKKLFLTQERAASFKEEWIKSLMKDDDGFHGPFITIKSSVVEYELDEPVINTNLF
jgi:hypothetical protein